MPLVAMLLTVILAALLSACSPLVDADQHANDATKGFALDSGSAIGQTFVAQHGGLSGLEIWLAPEGIVCGEIILHLRSTVDAGDDLRQSRLGLDQVQVPGFYRFAFQPLADSHAVDYYAWWELSPAEGASCTISVASGAGDSYLNGAAYYNHQPQDAQLVYSLVYDSTLMALDLARVIAVWGAWLLAAAALFLVPGFVLLQTLRLLTGLSLGAMLGLASGVGLSIYPLLLVWGGTAGLRLGRLYAFVPSGIAVTVCAFFVLRIGRRRGTAYVRQWLRSEAVIQDVILLTITGLVFLVRLVVIRTQDAPLWGDSVQHATIVQLILDNRGIFESWEPYAPFKTFTVHPGFHIITAVFAWLTKMSAVDATLVMGQLLNGLAVLTLYPLAERLSGGNRWVGVGAVLVGGLLSPMPAYYVNWGRYAQLAGQAILPVALWFLIDSVEHKSSSRGRLVLAGCTLAGTTLAYYRMPFFYGGFASVWLLVYAIASRIPRRSWVKVVVRLLGVAVVGVLLFLPWASRVIGGSQLVNKVGAELTSEAAWSSVEADYAVWRGVTTYAPLVLLIACACAVVWDAVSKRAITVIPILWYVIMASLPAGRLINLPGANMLQSFANLISLYIPVSLVSGSLLSVPRRVTEGSSRVFNGVVSLVVVGLAGAGAVSQLSILDTQYLMVTRPDIVAAAWISENVDEDAVFLVEGFTIYNGRSVVGSDAGWWLPVLAHRRTTMPPQYALLNDEPVEPDYPARLVELVSGLASVSASSTEGTRLMCIAGVTHVYIGQRQGTVGAGVSQLYNMEDLTSNPALKLVYQRDRAAVFELNRALCEDGLLEEP